MKQIGKVISSDSDKAVIQVIRESACGGNCSGCGSSCNTGVTISTINMNDVKQGEFVEIETASSQVIGIAAIFYIIPIIFIVMGVVISQIYFPSGLLGMTSDITSVLIAALLCALSFFLIHLFTKEKEIDYKITKL